MTLKMAKGFRLHMIIWVREYDDGGIRFLACYLSYYNRNGALQIGDRVTGAFHTKGELARGTKKMLLKKIPDLVLLDESHFAMDAFRQEIDSWNLGHSVEVISEPMSRVCIWGTRLPPSDTDIRAYWFRLIRYCVVQYATQ